MLTPLALYYYENPKQKQKGQIILPSSDSTLREGCNSFPEVKDKKLCFELVNNDRCFLVGSLGCFIGCFRSVVGWSVCLSDSESVCPARAKLKPQLRVGLRLISFELNLKTTDFKKNNKSGSTRVYEYSLPT